MTPDQLADIALPVVGAAALYRIWRDRHQAEIGKPVLPPVGKAGLVDRFWHPLIEPIGVGDADTEFFETHARILAMSGGFKTTLLAYMVRQRIEAGRPVVVLTGGDSDQLETEIRAHGGLVMRPESSPLRFNCFEGTPAFMAQTWAQLMPTGSVSKVLHGAFEQASLAYFESSSRYSIQGLRAFCMTYEPEDSGDSSRLLWKSMRENYLTIRLARVEKFLGGWIGDELSISDCIRHKLPVMFVIDSKDAPDLHELEAALVWQGMVYGVYQNGTTTGADLFVDEFGRLPRGLTTSSVRTFRRNKSHLVAASHTDRDFEDDDVGILEDLFHVNVLGRMVAGAGDTRKAASEMTWGVVHPTGFGAHALGHRRSRLDDVRRQPRKGYFWLVDQERVQEVKLQTYKPPKGYVVPPSPTKFAATCNPERFSGQNHGTGDGTGVTWKRARIRDYQVVEPSTGVVIDATFTTVSEAPTPSHPQLGSPTPTAIRVDGEMGTPNRRHGPPECPPVFLPPFATPREAEIWLRYRFPEGIDGCWELAYYCNPGTGRPEMEWRGSPVDPLPRGKRHWMAYMVVLVLWDLYRSHRPLGSKDSAAYITWIRANTSKMQRTVGHAAECTSKRCAKREHIDWQTNRDNVEQQWQAWRQRQSERKEKVG